MIRIQRQPTRHNLGALAIALLWGLVEVVALARSRWTHGQRG